MMINHPCACAGMGLLGLKKSACFIRDRVVSSARHCKFSGRPWPVDEQKAQQRPHFNCRRFFCACNPVLWRVARGHLRVCRVPFAPVGQPRAICHPHSLGRERWQFLSKRSYPMTALIPSRIRALAHRKMALSALRANSSLSVRLKRYNHHMDQARALEAQGGEQ